MAAPVTEPAAPPAETALDSTHAAEPEVSYHAELDAGASEPEHDEAAYRFQSDDPFFSSTAPLGELEAVAEPSIDDWFSEAAAEADAQSPPAVESLFPDLSSAAALPQPSVSPADEALDDVGAEWVPPTTDSSWPAESAAPAPASEYAADPESQTIEFTIESAAAAAPQAAIEAFVPEFTIEEPAAAAAAPEFTVDMGDAAPPAPVAEHVPALDVVADLAPAPDAFAAPDEASSWDDAPEAPEAPQPDPMVGMTPAFTASIPEETPAPFVTETMAELYLQQGFHDEALAIYRQLLSQSPTDASLQRRVTALEQGEESAVVDPGQMVGAAVPSSTSVRTFFARFATRTRRQAGGSTTEPNDPDSEGEGASSSFGGAATRDEAMTHPDESPATLTQVFAARAVSLDDAQAATSLASAFGVAAPADTTSGGELSLEQLFRDVEVRSPGAVTSGEYANGSMPGTPDEGSGTGVESHADIEQFTAWLEGLKKK